MQRQTQPVQYRFTASMTVLLAAIAILAGAVRAEAKRPNVVLVMTDDK